MTNAEDAWREREKKLILSTEPKGITSLVGIDSDRA